MTNITIVGAGAIGSAIGLVLKSKKDVKIDFWDKVPGKVKNQKSLKEIVLNADFLFFCLPSFALPSAISETKKFLNKKTIVISVSKGIEKKSHQFINILLKKSLPKNQGFTLLYGPMLANELLKNHYGAAIVASSNKQIFAKTKKIFTNTKLIVEYTSDVNGVAALGVLKNIYSIALGVARGLNWQNNLKGFLVSQALEEMSGLMPILGGQKTTVLSSAGAGDLIATGFSADSHNQKVGFKLGQGLKSEKASEGCYSLPILAKFLGKKINQFPLLSALEQIVVKNKKAKIVFDQLLKKI